MPRKGLRRFQLVLLVIVAGLVIWRMNAGPGGIGIVSLSDLEDRKLYEKTFEVFTPVTVHLDGIVAYEDERLGSVLAVIPWMVSRDTDEVVWTASADNLERDGVKAILADSLALVEGQYTLYLSTLGPDRTSWKERATLGLKPHWMNYESFWRMDLIAPEGSLALTPRLDKSSSSNGSLFQADLTSRAKESTIMLHVAERGGLQLEGGVTVCNDNCDDISLKSIPSGVVVWSLDDAETTASGGSRVNRYLSTTIELERGVYEFTFAPGLHHNGVWTETPPSLPYDWDFTLSSAASGRIRPLDPWKLAQPLIDQLGLGDSEMRQSRLTIEDSLDVIVFALGEMSSPSDRYDWGWIENEETGETVWQMEYEETSQGGGNRQNRSAKAILTLAPGTYLVGFKTDGSHSFAAGFNKSSPDNAERWGMAVFPLDPADGTKDGISVEQLDMELPTESTDDEAVAMGSRLDDIERDRFFVQRIELGNEMDVRESFEVLDTVKVIVAALGELSESSQYDYGWLDDLGSGERLWEMTYETTQPAGGDTNFRSAWIELTLAPGMYRAGFTTDGSISFGNFSSEIPDNPQDWGIAVFRTESE